MKIIRLMALAAVFAAGCFAQTGTGTVFYFGTHHYADQVLEPYPVGGLTNWYVVRAPQPPSYYSFSNLLDVHSVTVFKNGVALTAQGSAPEYGYFVISDPAVVYPPGFPVRAAGFQMVVILAGPVLPTDRLRVSYDYVQQ